MAAPRAGRSWVGLKWRDTGARSRTQRSELGRRAMSLKTAVEPLLALHLLESTNTCSCWRFTNSVYSVYSVYCGAVVSAVVTLDSPKMASTAVFRMSETMRFGGIISKETVFERLKRPLVDRSKLPRRSDNKQRPSSYPPKYVSNCWRSAECFEAQAGETGERAPGVNG
jgi:hypothetical protein